MSETIELNPSIPSHLIEIRAAQNPNKEIIIFEKGAEGEKKASETKKTDSEKETKKDNDTPASKTEKKSPKP